MHEICSASVDLERICAHWEQTAHLVASVHSGHTSAVHITARYGSASRGDPLYEAVVHLGRLLRTVFPCDYFLNDTFRRELLRVLNLRGVFRFPVERYADKILPSAAAEKTMAGPHEALKQRPDLAVRRGLEQPM